MNSILDHQREYPGNEIREITGEEADEMMRDLLSEWWDDYNTSKTFSEFLGVTYKQYIDWVMENITCKELLQLRKI